MFQRERVRESIIVAFINEAVLMFSRFQIKLLDN